MPSFIQNFDTKLLFCIQNSLHNSLMDKLMMFFTFLGDGSLIWIVICIVSICTKKYRRAGLMGICALILSTLISEYIVKLIVQRPRPFEIYTYTLLIPAPGGYSFPSSHTAESFAAAGILFKSVKNYGFLFVILALLISFSRLYLFVHFPSDVLAGAIIGMACSAVTCCVFKPLKKA